MGCGHDQTRESLNEVQNLVSHLSALGDQFSEHVIPKDGLGSNVPVCLKCGQSGRSFLPLLICLNSFCQMKVGQFLECEIPTDGLSLNALDDLFCRSFLLCGLMSFALRMVCQKKVGQFLGYEIPKDGQNVMLAYARLLNLNRGSRYKNVCLTSSFFPGGRRLVLRCVVYQSTRALVRGHLIGVHRRSFWFRALRGHQLCGEACDLLQFWVPLAPSCCRGQACDHSSREGRQRLCGGSFWELLLRSQNPKRAWGLILMRQFLDAVLLCRN